MENKNKKWGGGGYYYEINVFSSNTCWTKLLVPLGILMSKIYLKCIPIHVHNFEHSRVIMNMKLSSHGCMSHINMNRRGKKQRPNSKWITHHNEKKTKNISDVQQKIVELQKLKVSLKKSYSSEKSNFHRQGNT